MLDREVAKPTTWHLFDRDAFPAEARRSGDQRRNRMTSIPIGAWCT
jgi:hypothetical protein